jgi:flagellar assembly protein FliH
MSAYAKFSFETIDAGSPANRRKVDRRAIGPADLEAARAEGVEQGRRDAVASAAQAEAQALNAMARMMQLVLGRVADEAQGLREDAAELALTIARTLSGELLDRHGGEAVEAFVADALRHLRSGPRLVVQVAPELVEALTPRLEQVARDAGFEGALVVRPANAALPGDCTLEWAEGSIQHDRAAALETIEAAAREWLDSADQHGRQMDLFNGGTQR